MRRELQRKIVQEKREITAVLPVVLIVTTIGINPTV